MQKLESLGTEQTRKVLMRHGARDPFFGVKVEDLKKVVKEIRSRLKDTLPDKITQESRRHEIALELYSTGNSDAMYLAGLLADPSRMDPDTLQNWVEAAYWSMISDYTVAWVASESRFGWEMSLKWIDSNKELIASAGWATLSSIVSITPDEKLDLQTLRDLTRGISGSIVSAPNRVRYSMNSYLISVASYVPELTNIAREVAEMIGTVTVHMGGTACKVPYAPDYIRKVEQMGRIGIKRKSAQC
jgi:hypothetical protein